MVRHDRSEQYQSIKAKWFPPCAMISKGHNDTPVQSQSECILFFDEKAPQAMRAALSDRQGGVIPVELIDHQSFDDFPICVLHIFRGAEGK